MGNPYPTRGANALKPDAFNAGLTAVGPFLTRNSEPGAVDYSRPVRGNEEYVRHADTVWTDARYKDEPIAGVVGEWLMHLESRPRATSPETIKKYRNSLLSFTRSVEAAGETPALGAMTRFAVDRWVSQQRLAGLSSEGIASRLGALKSFSRAYLWLEAEYTIADLLAKVKRPKPEETAKPMLDEAERGAIFDAFARHGGYEDTRNAAFVAVQLATGLRYKAVLELTLDRLDASTGAVTVTEKGGAVCPAQISPGAMKLVRRWLRTRRAADGVTAVWTTDAGQPLSYWGGRSWFQRLKKRSGVQRLHPHLLRHTFGQVAIVKGATPGEVQDMLHHRTAAMTTRYTKTVRAQAAAANMPRYSVV